MAWRPLVLEQVLIRIVRTAGDLFKMGVKSCVNLNGQPVGVGAQKRSFPELFAPSCVQTSHFHCSSGASEPLGRPFSRSAHHPLVSCQHHRTCVWLLCFLCQDHVRTTSLTFYLARTSAAGGPNHRHCAGGKHLLDTAPHRGGGSMGCFGSGRRLLGSAFYRNIKSPTYSLKLTASSQTLIFPSILLLSAHSRKVGEDTSNLGTG